MKVAEDAGNAPRLREENLALHKENMKIQKELDESRQTLEDSESRFKAQNEKDASIILDLENTLRDRLEEITEMDKNLFGKLLTILFHIVHSFFLAFLPSFNHSVFSRAFSRKLRFFSHRAYQIPWRIQ